MQQRLADFLYCATIVQRAAHMAFEFLRALERGEGGEGDQAAGLQRQAFAVPHAAPGMFVDEVLQRLGEFGSVAQGAVDERIAHHLTTHFYPWLFRIGHCDSLLCWRRQARSVLNNRKATSTGRT